MPRASTGESMPTVMLKKVPLFFADVSTITDGNVDEWTRKMVEYVLRVTGPPLVDGGPESGDTEDSPSNTK